MTCSGSSTVLHTGKSTLEPGTWSYPKMGRWEKCLRDDFRERIAYAETWYWAKVLKDFYLYKLDNQIFSLKKKNAFAAVWTVHWEKSKARGRGIQFKAEYKLSTITDLQASLVAVGLENRLATGIVKTRIGEHIKKRLNNNSIIRQYYTMWRQSICVGQNGNFLNC